MGERGREVGGGTNLPRGISPVIGYTPLTTARGVGSETGGREDVGIVGEGGIAEGPKGPPPKYTSVPPTPILPPANSTARRGDGHGEARGGDARGGGCAAGGENRRGDGGGGVDGKRGWEGLCGCCWRGWLR